MLQVNQVMTKTDFDTCENKGTEHCKPDKCLCFRYINCLTLFFFSLFLKLNSSMQVHIPVCKFSFLNKTINLSLLSALKMADKYAIVLPINWYSVQSLEVDTPLKSIPCLFRSMSSTNQNERKYVSNRQPYLHAYFHYFHYYFLYSRQSFDFFSYKQQKDFALCASAFDYISSITVSHKM